MDNAAEHVLEQALQLPRSERLAVARRLYENADDADIEPRVKAAQLAEIDRRMAAYQRGEVTAIPAEQVLAEIEARYS